MIKYFNIDPDQGVSKGSDQEFNWLAIDQDSPQEVEKILQEYSLPQDIFVGADSAGEVSRVEHLKNTKLKNPLSVVVLNLADKDQTIEKRIEPISFVLSDDLLLTYTGKNSPFIDNLLDQHGAALNSFEKVLATSLLSIYNHFIAGLKALKKEIDALDQAARKTTESKELFRLADVDRAVIFIDHTLTDQNDMLEKLWNDEKLLEKIDDEALIYDVQLRQKQAQKLVEVYHELIDTIGALFGSMIDSNLNHLMKYLESAALILTIPTVTAGIWGMNTGGLPWEKSDWGFWIVMTATVILTILTAIHLVNKNYFK